MIARLRSALLRRLRQFLARRANHRLTATFLRAGAIVDGPCHASGALRPLVVVAGRLHLGPRTYWAGVTQRSEIHVECGATLTVGHNVFFNQGITIAAHRSIEIGPDCLIGEQVAIHDTSFHAVTPDRPVRTAPVHIGRNVWLGHRAIVLPGVEIGDHSVVGAGAVVTRSLPARCIAVGAPARVVATFECPDDWKRR